MRTREIVLIHVALALLVLTSVPMTVFAGAQFGRLGDAARRAAEAAKKAAESRPEAPEETNSKEASPPPTAGPSEPSAPSSAPATPTAASSGAAPALEAASAPSFQAYSKFDFVPGETVVAVDDFSQDAIGDFPDKWNTDGSAEVVTIGGKSGRWLKITRGGFFTPEFISDLPENFTLEFDLMVPPTFEPGFALNVALVQLENVKLRADWGTAPNSFQFTLLPGAEEGASTMTVRDESTSAAANQARTPQLAAKDGNPIHLSVWRQRQRVRVYINQEKMWDIPRGVAASARLNSLIFSLPEAQANSEYFLSNIRVATGAPDTRNKILTEGKWVSHGILFDVNSDRIKGESYGSLKEIAGVLGENRDLKVQIVGHTDSDGDETANLDLSRRRAASVKASLTREFGIDAGRMDTDGKGESQPVDSNNTPAGKANNRRVEFIKK